MSENYEKIFRIPAGTPMSAELLAKYIGRHKALVQSQYRRYKDAYENRYDVYRLPKKAAYKPDNRISVNFAKYIVDVFNGFFSGIPARITSPDESVQDYLSLLYSYNSGDDLFSEESKNADIFGRCYEMYYVDEDSRIGITYVSPMQAFMLYDDSILERPMYFVRYYKDADNVEIGSYSDTRFVQHFRNNGAYKFTDEPRMHGFDGVPATEFVENAERMSLIDSALSMINSFNKGISEKANDVDSFSDAYMKIKGKQLGGDDVKTIRDDRVINLWSDDPELNQYLDAEFMSRPNGDQTQEHHLERLERLIFVTSMVPNISDNNFATTSGIALKYKLKPMSDLAKTKQNKFSAAFSRRYRLIFSNPIVRTAGVPADAWMKLDYNFSLNYPTNIQDEAQTARNLEGVVSKETQLSTLSIVDDPQEEMDRMAQEQADIANAQIGNLFSSGGD